MELRTLGAPGSPIAMSFVAHPLSTVHRLLSTDFIAPSPWLSISIAPWELVTAHNKTLYFEGSDPANVIHLHPRHQIA